MSIEIVTIGLFIFEWDRIARSVKGAATGWSVRGSNSVQARDALYSRPAETDPGAHPASCAVGTEDVTEEKRPIKHQNTEIKNGQSYASSVSMCLLGMVEDDIYLSSTLIS